MAVSVRIFASHPVANLQYTRTLTADKDVFVAAEDLRFDVGVFDCDPLSVEKAVAMARVKAPSMKPLLLSNRCDEHECLRWILRGIWGLVTYSRYEEELPRAVRQIAEGQLWFPPHVVMRWMQTDAALHARASGLSLTGRERETVELLARQLSNKEIANILRISESTVKFHVGHILAKLEVKTRQELTSTWLSFLRVNAIREVR